MTAPELPRPPRNLGCEVCGSHATVVVTGLHGRRCANCPPELVVENVDPLAAFVILRAWFSWWIDERYATAAGRFA